MTPTSGLDNATTYFKLIRSKDAGPFMLTIDLFFEGREAYDAFAAAEVFTAESIGNLYGVAPASVDIYNIPDIDAVKISFPRPVVSGDFGDTDITGGQQYGLIIDMVSALHITTDPLRVVRQKSPSSRDIDGFSQTRLDSDRHPAPAGHRQPRAFTVMVRSECSRRVSCSPPPLVRPGRRGRRVERRPLIVVRRDPTDLR